MEVFSFACAKAGLPSVDLVSQLSGVEFDGLSLAGNLVGAIAHLSIGVCWAVFYAFFFWGRLRIRPAFQGLSFAILPAALAILVVYPELALMRLQTDVVRLSLPQFYSRFRFERSLRSSSTMGFLV